MENVVDVNHSDIQVLKAQYEGLRDRIADLEEALFVTFHKKVDALCFQMAEIKAFKKIVLWLLAAILVGLGLLSVPQLYKLVMIM